MHLCSHQIPQRTEHANTTPELVNIHNAFHQGQCQTVLDFDTSALSPENHLPARVLQLRARIAQGQPEQALSDINNSDDASNPDIAAVKALAQYVKGGSGSDKEGAVGLAQRLAEGEGENGSVQVCCGTVLQGEGRSEEALGLLGKHQGSLEAYVYLTIYTEILRDTVRVKKS